MKINKKKIIYWAALALCIAVFLGSAGYLGYRWYQSKKNTDLNSELQSMKGTAAPTQEATLPPSDATQDPTEPTEPTILPEYQALYERNNELVGWLSIPDTNIDYPVVQSRDDPDYYLHRNFDKEYSYAGTLYARPVSDIYGPSDNITIYGHRMEIPGKDMFYELDKFKGETWWKTHQTFTFDTIYEHHTYQLVAVFRTLGTSEGYPYHRFVDAKNEEEFNQFISDIKAMADYETGVTAQYGDKLLCLSTCEYTLGRNSRFVVVAKRIS